MMLHETYHTLFFLEIRKYVRNLSSAAVVIGGLRVNMIFMETGCPLLFDLWFIILVEGNIGNNG